MPGIILLLATLGLAEWFDAGGERAPGVLYADFGATAVIAIVSFLGSLFGLFGGKADKNIVRAFEGIRDVIVNVGRELARFAAETAALFARLVGLLRRFWARVLLPFLRRLDGWVDRIQKWLRSTFKPIIDFLLRVRKYILDFYDKWFKPIFDTIDVIRRVLGLLSFLHLDFARKLDEKFAAIEHRLRVAIDALIRKVNEAIDDVDRVMTLDGFFQRVTLLRSLARDVGRINAIWHAAHSRPLSADERRASPGAPGLKPPEQSTSDFDRYLRTGDGPIAAWVTEWGAEFDDRLRAA